MALGHNESLIFLIVFIMLASFGILFSEKVGAEMVDYRNIWACIKDGVFPTSGHPVSSCEAYPPLLIFIGSIFSAREIMFQQFLLVLNFGVVPLALYMVTRRPVTVWFYFSATNYAFAVLTSAFFAQALAMALTLSMIWMKDWQRIGVLFLTIIAHSTGFYFALAFLVLLKAEEYVKEYGFPDVKKTVLGCSPIWGSGPPAVLSETLANAGVQSGSVTINTIGSLLLKRTPVFFLLPAVKELWDRKKIALLGWMLMSVAAGFLVHERGFYFAALPMVLGLAWFYDSHPEWRLHLVVASALFFAFNVHQFLGVLACAGL